MAPGLSSSSSSKAFLPRFAVLMAVLMIGALTYKLAAFMAVRDAETLACLNLDYDIQTVESQIRRTKRTVESLQDQLNSYPKMCKIVKENVTGPMFKELQRIFLEHDQCVYTANAAIAIDLMGKTPKLPINNNNFRDVKLMKKVIPDGKRKVAMIVNVDPSSMRQFASQLASLTCYATLHKVTLHTEFIVVQTDRDEQRRRIRTILKYLPHYDWVIGVDPATKVVNYSRPVQSYLDPRSDVVIMQRGEEAASMHIAFKRGDYGVNFLKEWMDIGSKSKNKKNSANGDLLELLLRRFFPEEAKSMQRGDESDPSWATYEAYKRKFAQLFWDRDVGTYFPIKVYKEGQGFINYAAQGPRGVFDYEFSFQTLTEDELYCRPKLLTEGHRVGQRRPGEQ